METVNITPYDLATWMRAHGLKFNRLAELMGMSASTLMSLFNRNRNWRGSERRFTPALVASLNEALPQFAGKLVRAHVFFDVTQAVQKRTRAYDPSCVARLKETVLPLVALRYLMADALEWSESKTANVLTIAKSRVYGNVSREDVQRINDTLDALASTLMSFHVVMPDYAESKAVDAVVADPTTTAAHVKAMDLEALRAKPAAELTEEEQDYLCELDALELGAYNEYRDAHGSLP